MTVPIKLKQDAQASPDRAELEQQPETIHRSIRRLQFEKDALKEGSVHLKSEPGIDFQSLTTGEKAQLVDALGQTCMLAELLKEVDLARRCYLYRRARPQVADRYPDMRQAMTGVF